MKHINKYFTNVPPVFSLCIRLPSNLAVLAAAAIGSDASALLPFFPAEIVVLISDASNILVYLQNLFLHPIYKKRRQINMARS